jgi:hypothetical protein
MRHACAYASVVWKRVGYYGTIEVIAGTLQPVHSEVDISTTMLDLEWQYFKSHTRGDALMRSQASL